MESSDSSLRSKSDGEKGHSGGNFGLTKTFSASSFMLGEADSEVARRTTGVVVDVKPAAVESFLKESKVRRLQRMVDSEDD
jgi:hypothetical protein